MRGKPRKYTESEMRLAHDILAAGGSQAEVGRRLRTKPGQAMEAFEKWEAKHRQAKAAEAAVATAPPAEAVALHAEVERLRTEVASERAKREDERTIFAMGYRLGAKAREAGMEEMLERTLLKLGIVLEEDVHPEGAIRGSDPAAPVLHS